MTSKYKFNMKGWFKDSWRHMLAARGIKTKYDKANSRKLFATKLYIVESKSKYPKMVKTKFGDVDASIGTHISSINKSGFETMASCSGMTKDHRCKAITPGLSSYVSVGIPEEKIDRSKIGADIIDLPLESVKDKAYLGRLQEAGEKAGWEAKTNKFMIGTPVVRFNLPETGDVKLDKKIESSPDWMIADKDVEMARIDNDDWRKKLEQRERVRSKLYKIHAGGLKRYSDEETKERWDKLVKELRKYGKELKSEEKEVDVKMFDAKKPTSTWSEPSIGPQLVGRRKQYEPLPTVSREFLDDVSWLKDQGASYKDLKQVYPNKKPAVKAAWMKLEGVEKQ